MLSREELERHLSVLRTEEILRFLRDDTLLEIANRYFASGQTEVEPTMSLETPASTVAGQSGEPSTDRAKRPLNAFMAFRSKHCRDFFLYHQLIWIQIGYYLRLFPELQQKTASGFLTTLWNKDPYRNKWALIAKVYSFVRDQLGRDKVSLSYFLNASCPVMKITEPSTYLSAFGWSVGDEDGSPKLFQADNDENITQPTPESGDYPNTEIELLSAIINAGYLPDDSVNLLERMGASGNGTMTTASGSTPVPSTRAKQNFMRVIETDPYQAARDLMGRHYEERNVPALGVRSHSVDDLNSVGHLPLQFAYPDPRQIYNYASSSYASSSSQQYQADVPQMGYFPMNEGDTYDVDNPWDIDKMLGYSENEGDRGMSICILQNKTEESLTA